VIFLAVYLLALLRGDMLVRAFTFDLGFFRVYHVLWLAAFLVILKRFIPAMNPKMNLGKIYAANYVQTGEDTAPKRERLKRYVRKVNVGAVRSAIYWTLAVLFVGVLWYFGFFDRTMLFVTVVFFIFMDQFCISVWCPFTWIIGHKCCVTCRINNWGYLMAFSPLVYMPSFWTYSILLLSGATVVHWEYLFRKHPERFYELYNANLMCKNCRRPCRTRKKAPVQSADPEV
jgi:hypothetical protein